jgi:hypothetical protein
MPRGYGCGHGGGDGGGGGWYGPPREKTPSSPVGRRGISLSSHLHAISTSITVNILPVLTGPACLRGRTCWCRLTRPLLRTFRTPACGSSCGRGRRDARTGGPTRPKSVVRVRVGHRARRGRSVRRRVGHAGEGMRVQDARGGWRGKEGTRGGTMYGSVCSTLDSGEDNELDWVG